LEINIVIMIYLTVLALFLFLNAFLFSHGL
jgi:hypothetical protein